MRRRVFLIALTLAAAGILWGVAKAPPCPGDPCWWRWWSSTCAFLCPIPPETGPIEPDIGVPVREPATP